jgi:hypothetical protein
MDAGHTGGRRSEIGGGRSGLSLEGKGVTPPKLPRVGKNKKGRGSHSNMEQATQIAL